MSAYGATPASARWAARELDRIEAAATRPAPRVIAAAGAEWKDEITEPAAEPTDALAEMMRASQGWRR